MNSKSAKRRSFLAFDLGSSKGRAILGTISDNRLFTEELCRFPNEPVVVGNTIYWDVLAIFGKVKEGLRKYSQEYNKHLSSVGVDTWGVDFALIDENGELLSNPVHYRDKRTEGVMEETFKRITKQQIFRETGIQFMQINTLYQLLAMKENNSSILSSAARLLMMADLFNYFLTGQKLSELTLATTTQLYNPLTKDWSKKLFKELELPHEIMPPVVQPGTKIAELLPTVCEEVELRNTQVVAPACHDTGSAVVAVPAASTDWAFISSGTWSIIGVEVDSPIITERACKYSFSNEGGVENTFRFLRNISGLWLIQECKRQWHKSGETFSYKKLTHLAAEAKQFGAFIDPDNEVFLTPGSIPYKVRNFCRETCQSEPKDKGELIRCVLESLAFKYRYVLNKLEEMLGRELEVIHVVGGGASNHLLCQFTANATQKLVIAGPVEASGIGNLLIQAIGMGALSSLDEARELVKNSFDLKAFKPEDITKWERAYDRFQDII